MRENFLDELRKSGWIHRPLSVNKDDSIEADIKNKKVLLRKPLWCKKSDGDFSVKGQGNCRIVQEEDKEYLRMEGKLKLDYWPEGMPGDGDCAYYGNLGAVLKPEFQDWTAYNRLHFSVRPLCPGLHTISLSAWVKNEGKEKVPDKYNRTGQHMMNLENEIWNDCIWEISSMGRDCITELEFRYRLSGSDTGFGESAVFEIKDIYLEKTEEEKYRGWDLEEGKISYDTCGYFPGEKKTALIDAGAESFCILKEDTEEVVLEKKVESRQWKENLFGIMDFSEVTEKGSYKIVTQGKETGTFQIGEDWAEEIVWKGLNFLFCQRCGYPVPGKHGCCHLDCYAVHNNEKISYSGGWHDAGDMSQQTIQTAEITEELFLTAEQNKENIELYERLMEEACWGLSFILRSRFGDGYRATSLGLIRWTDGRLGTQDDAGNVRVYNHAIDNFICACTEAAAARVLKEYDKQSSFAALEAAKQDYDFALERFREYGFEVPIMWEHTYGTSDSLCYAIISKCAGLLYQMTGETKYKETAGEFIKKLLECQETGGKLGGFFYRDRKQNHIVHFNHQAREKYFAESLILACEIFKDEECGADFKKGLERYGNYLEFLMEYASPYGMMPAGIYKEEEAEHREVFERMHLQSKYEDCREDYLKQVRNGTEIGDGWYVRQFPVWFSFRGNANVQLSMGQSAVLTGIYLKRQSLIQAATEQIHWLNGKNPFVQSFMTGNGKRFGFFYAVFPGICTGQVPVGMQTNKNEDIPFWTMGNQATHREVWTSGTIKMMSICGKLMKNL